MKKRLIGICLAVVMIFANLTALAYTDVSSTLEKTSVALVEGLGIMEAAETDQFGSGAYITKGEFALAVANMMRLDVVEGKMGNSVFGDVDISTKQGCAINLLADTGVIPTTLSKYGPSDIITYGEAARMIINALGYGYEVTINGGYPSGVIKVAAQLKLASGISATTNTQLTRINAAIVIYNALMTETIDISLTGGNASYTKSGETLLEEVWDVYYDYGTILGVGLTSLDGVSLSETQVSLNGEVMECSIPTIKDYLGYSVKAYYMNDSTTGDTVLVAVVPRSADNTSKTIEADDLLVSGNTVKYDSDGKVQTQYIAKNGVQVVYNGRLYENYKTLEDVLDIDEGYVTFVSNDGTKYANLIIVTEEKHILVERVDAKNEIAYAANSTDEKADPYLASALDLGVDNKDIYITMNGATASFSDIEINDVLVVVETPDGEEINVRIDRNLVEGKIGAVEDDGEVRINGVSYDASVYAKDAFTAGTSGTFAATADGKLLGVITTKTSSLKYAYVLKAVTHDVNEEKAYVKLFTQDGELRIFVVDEKTVINGKKVMFNEVKNLISEGEFISFKLNSDGNIAQMNRPYDTTSNPDYYSNSSFIKNWSKSSVRYNGGIMGRSIVTDTTTIFYIPRYDREVDSDYRILSIGDLSNRVYSDVTCYDVDRNGRIGAVLIKEDIKETVESDDALFFVDKVLTAVDEDGDDIVEVQGYQSGEEVTLYFNEDTDSVTYEDGWMNYTGNEDFDTGYNSKLPGANLRPGDAIQYALSADGTVGAYRIIYNNALAIYTSGELTYDDPKYYYERWSKSGNVTKLDFKDDLYIGLGAVEIRYNDFMCFCALNEEERTQYKNSIVNMMDYYRPFNLVQPKTYIYTYNVDSKRVEIGTMEDVEKNDTVFVRSDSMGDLNEIMVYVESN